VEVWAFSTGNLLAGRVWTPLTALFIHADILHLAGNMIFLYVFGNTLEKDVGTGKTFVAFFVGGILAFLIGVFFYSPSALMVGASAAIFTLTAFVMLVKPLKFSFVFLMPVGLVAVIYFIYNVLAIQFGVETTLRFSCHRFCHRGYLRHILGQEYTQKHPDNHRVVHRLSYYYVVNYPLFTAVGRVIIC
jgi:membrane associated rhomboid family serine protease